MRRYCLSLLIAVFAVTFVTANLAAPANARMGSLYLLSSCHPKHDRSLQLISWTGEELPAGTGYLAYTDQGDGRAMAYRQNAVEMAMLVEEIAKSGAADTDPEMLQPRYWAAKKKPCQVNKSTKRCEGNCDQGKKCLEKEGVRPNDPEPCECRLAS